MWLVLSVSFLACACKQKSFNRVKGRITFSDTRALEGEHKSVQGRTNASCASQKVASFYVCSVCQILVDLSRFRCEALLLC